MLVLIMILKDTTTFQVLFIVSLFCVWNITTVEINMAFTYLKVKSAKCLCLLLVVLVLLYWSWSCKQLSWSWFGLVTLVFVLVLRIWSCLHHCLWEKCKQNAVQSLCFF